MSKKKKIGVILFPEFELLDVFGPLEMYGIAKEDFDISIISFNTADVASAQGPKVVVDESPKDEKQCDILLVPGGIGTRSHVNNSELIEWIARQATYVEYVTSVCTGSILLAKAGLLNGLKATTNKRAFDWVESAGGEGILWQRSARWVEEGKYFTSSGISAGIDMALAVISKIHGIDQARAIAARAEYIWNEDSELDQFAV